MTDINAFYDLSEIGQSRRFRAYVKVIVDGRDVTNRLDPYLVSVLVKDANVWECTIELDDRDARLDIPPVQAPLSISFGWSTEGFSEVFTGFVSDVEHAFGRKLGGRRMFVHGSGYGQASSVKTPWQDHIGTGPPPGKMEGDPIAFPQAAMQFAANAGLTVDVGSSFAGTIRDYWSMNNESSKPGNR